MFNESVVTVARVVWPEGLRADEAGAGGSITLSDPDWAAGPAGQGWWTLVDFGDEVFGSARSTVRAVDGGESAWVRIQVGESVGEAMAGASAQVERPVRAGETLATGVTGFRFARVDLLDSDRAVTLAGPVATNRVRDLPRLGSFRCSDQRLERVWEAGARTVHLGMQDHVWDGIKRGQSVWAGDLWPAAATIGAVFGPQPIVPASLDHVRRRSDDPEGLAWLNDIPTYSLWWIVTQWEWYQLTGDRDYLARQGDYLGRLLQRVDEGVDARGREQFEGWRYLDWATTHDPDAVAAGTQGLLAWSLRAARAIGAALGEPALTAQADAILARVTLAPPVATRSQAAQALLALGGLADPVAVHRDHLAPDPMAGLTPFLGYAVLEARARAGDHAGALALIRSYWGAMLDLGATTFWEDFESDWATNAGRIDALGRPQRREIHAGLGRNARRGFGLSLCHPWSAGPTAWLSHHVLGVTPVEPGGRVVRVIPHLGDLAWAEGSVPVASGLVHVRHERDQSGRVVTNKGGPPDVQILSTP